MPHYQDAGRGRAGMHWAHDTYDQGIWGDDILGQWVTLLMYHKKGDKSTGRYRVKIVKQDGSEQELFKRDGLDHAP